MHHEAREAVEKVRRPGEHPHAPLRGDELDRLTGMGMTRYGKGAVARTIITPEQLAIDYRAISGLDAPTASRPSSADSYTSPDPRPGLVEPTNRAFPGEEDFGVVPPAEHGLPQHSIYRAPLPPQPYILDASWQDFVAQLGF